MREKRGSKYSFMISRSRKMVCRKTAVISSSKSCAMILDTVKLSDFSDVRVDGVDSEILGISGKPAPDIFIEATRRKGLSAGQRS